MCIRDRVHPQLGWKSRDHRLACHCHRSFCIYLSFRFYFLTNTNHGYHYCLCLEFGKYIFILKIYFTLIKLFINNYSFISFMNLVTVSKFIKEIVRMADNLNNTKNYSFPFLLLSVSEFYLSFPLFVYQF